MRSLYRGISFAPRSRPLRLFIPRLYFSHSLLASIYSLQFPISCALASFLPQNLPSTPSLCLSVCFFFHLLSDIFFVRARAFRLNPFFSFLNALSLFLISLIILTSILVLSAPAESLSSFSTFFFLIILFSSLLSLASLSFETSCVFTSGYT